MPNTGQAADIKFTPQVQIPGYTFNSADKSTGNIANLVRAIYKYAIGIVGILAAVVLMVGGVLWIVAGGNATAIGEAKAWIGASLTGLVIALCSYLILATVNPALVDLKTTGIKTVEDASKGCCQDSNNEGTEKNCGMITASQCGGTWLGSDYICSGNKTCLKINTLNATTKEDCENKGGSVSGVVSQTLTNQPLNLCKATCIGKNKQASDESFYISTGQNYITGYCCLCK